MAGFSGGRKAVMPGVSAYTSIQDNHRLCLQPEAGQGIDDGCTAGGLADNEMHQDMLEMAELLNPAFLLNAVHTPDGDFACFQAGHWREAWLAGCSVVEQIYGVEISGTADIALVSAGGFPKDINFYQASKAIENACGAVRPGGVLIALMECRDIAEPQDFSQWFGYRSLYEQEAALRQSFTVPGFVALKLRLIACQTAVIVVTLPQNRDFLERAGMIVAVSVEEALQIAISRLGTEEYKITVMPQGASTMPVFKA
jgi:nickel-dependent lactate racemase